MRIRIDLAYDGTDFHGWATQPRLRTVQGELEAALATVLRVPEAPVVCAGRTDTGVHARGQVVHLDVDGRDLAASAGRSDDPPAEALLAPAQRDPRPRRAGTPRCRGPGRVRRPVLRAVAPLRLPGRRPTRRRWTR